MTDQIALPPDKLLKVLMLHEQSESQDVDFLFELLATTDDLAKQKALVAGFRKQVWYVAAQEAWDAATCTTL